MSERLKALMEQLETDRLVSAQTFQVESADLMLTLREDVAFDSEWVRAQGIVDCGKLATKDRDFVNAIREFTFKRAYDLTSNPDLSACVSDDFELIASAMALDIADPWINGLWDSYKKGYFPYCAIQLVPGSIML